MRHWSQSAERPLAIVAFLGCQAVSVVLTVRFTLSLAGGIEPIVVGVVLELAKLLFAIVAVNRYRQRSFGALAVAMALAMTLAGISAVASAAFFDAATARYGKRVAVASQRLDRLERHLHGLEREQELLTRAAEQDLARNYRSRALDAQARTVEVRRQLDATNQQLDEAVEQAPPDAVVRVASVASIVGRYRFATVLALAVLLEAIGLAALQLAGRPSDRTRPPIRRSLPPSRPRLRVVHGDADDLSDTKIERMTDRVIDGLRSGSLRPTLRDVRAVLGVRQTVAQRVMYRLVETGVLVRQRRGYRFVASG